MPIKPINQSINQSTNQSANQPTNSILSMRQSNQITSNQTNKTYVVGLGYEAAVGGLGHPGLPLLPLPQPHLSFGLGLLLGLLI